MARRFRMFGSNSEERKVMKARILSLGFPSPTIEVKCMEKPLSLAFIAGLSFIYREKDFADSRSDGEPLQARLPKGCRGQLPMCASRRSHSGEVS